MAKIIAQADVGLSLTFVVNEDEARALDALVGYGDDAFVKAFYEKLGEAYMKRHERGLRSFFQSIRDEVPGVLSRVDAARVAFNKKGGAA